MPGGRILQCCTHSGTVAFDTNTHDFITSEVKLHCDHYVTVPVSFDFVDVVVVHLRTLVLRFTLQRMQLLG